MPAGRSPLLLAAAFYALVVTAILSASEWTLPPVLLTIQLVFLAAVVTVVALHMVDKRERAVQTLTALYATSGVMSLVPLLLRGLVGLGFDFVLNTLLIILFFWSFAIDAFIFSRALNSNMWMGLFVSVTLFILTQFLLNPWQVLPA